MMKLISAKIPLLFCFLVFSVKAQSSTYSEKYFDQNLDHSSTTSKTFKQRYYHIDKFAKSVDAPVLVEICGEWECLVNEGNLNFDLAKKIGAHLIILEHRYFGKSTPFKLLTKENLSYLTFENVLSDIANFQTSLVEQKGLTGNWIYTGVSYAGTVAAYFQLEYPHLAAGAVASSAPMKGKLIFDEIDSHAYNTLTPSCRAAVLAANKDIEKYFLNGTQKLFKATLFFDYPIVEEEYRSLAGLLAIGMIQLGPNFISFFCTSIEATPNAETIAKFHNNLKIQDGIDVFGNFGLGLGATKNLKYGKNKIMRQWTYLSCRVFGFFQPANLDRNQSILPASLGIDIFLKTCEDEFGVLDVQGNIDEFNAKYFEKYIKNPKGASIITTNGSIDHWKLLSVIDEKYLHDKSHGADLSNIYDSAIMRVTRLRIYNQVRAWAFSQ